MIHEVPGDGDCLFNSIVYQLHENSSNSTSMRGMHVTHLRDNALHYRGFVHQQCLLTIVTCIMQKLLHLMSMMGALP